MSAVFDLAGIENELSDGHATPDERRALVESLTTEVMEKGGSLAEWTR